jgi:hypothetical protein
MLPLFRNPRLDPRKWSSPDDWTLECDTDAIERTPAFGKTFFDRLCSEFAIRHEDLQFFRWSQNAGDVYAFFDRVEEGFYVQIDIDLEYIIVNGRDGTGEYGNWGNGNDQVQDALEYVRSFIRINA